ncbi:uncharacterized protein N7496_009660 [Penicillium cataractarum]|uniref:Zn(2)-C6 fungal-type domain-containing protein n=1 Tax=Penicillium cataractarum TaxID=2100454 RepID=A0A9W9RPK7_9EURO|nr:uncharacterized protein N7496_009660 [Penicillium cataractarum]KAJ5363947.1 hypothetical protein N7496_009660 [Penicillium cataractarum]
MPASKPIKRACDQCHSVKEKCRRLSTETSCERCDRLGHKCRTTRNAAKTGRKPQVLREVTYTVPSKTRFVTAHGEISDKDHLKISFLSYNSRLAINSALLSDLDDWERHFLNLMRNITAPSPLAKFLVGTSFHESHHSSFLQNFMQPSQAILRNASVACAAALVGDQYDEYAQNGLEVGHRRAALAVSSLRSLKINTQQDLVTALVLGVALLTFAMHVENGQPFLISHFTLSLIKTQHPDLLGLDPSLMDFLMCLVTAETFDCLLRSHVPTLRVNDRESFVDRYLGLSSSMLSYFYDIAEVSNLLGDGAMAENPELLRRLNEIKLAVEQWQPLQPGDFLQRFTHIEVATMMAQAKILRFTALLIIHRLNYPFGQQNGEALRLSQAIATEFETVIRLTNHSIPCTSLAYLAACFEIMDREARAIAMERSTQIITFSKQTQIRFKATVTSVWEARDTGIPFYWFELSKYVPNTEAK